MARGAAHTLYVLLLTVAAPWPTPADDAKPLTAILISARTELPDPFFADAVVLVMNNLGPAPVGVVINRPTSVAVSRLFPDMKRLEPLKDRVYFGGPVELDSVWFLFRALKAPEHAIRACDGVYLSASRELLLRLLDREKPMEGLRIFMGHAGWGPGQLEAEIARGDWKMAHANPEAIFSRKSEHPWPPPQMPGDGT